MSIHSLKGRILQLSLLRVEDKPMEKIQFITHCNGHISHVESARLALEGGCRWIQLRMKGASWEDIIRTGEKVKSLCQRYNATFISNDSADLCGFS